LIVNFPLNAPKTTAETPIIIRVGQESEHNGIVVVTNPDSYGIEITEPHIWVYGQVNGEPHLRVTKCGNDGVHVHSGSHHIILSCLEVDNNGNGQGHDGIELNASSSVNSQKSVLTVEHCKLHDNFKDQVHITGSRGPNEFSRVIIRYCEIYGLHNDGIECGICGLEVHDNFLHTFNGRHWETEHPDGIVVTSSYSRVYNNILYNLYKEGDEFGIHLYAGLMYDLSGTEKIDVSHLYFFNNLVYLDNQPMEVSNKGFELTTKESNNIASLSHVLIANNTYVGTPGLAFNINFGKLGSSLISDVLIINNIVANCGRSANGFIVMVGNEGYDDWTTGSWGDPVDVIFDHNVVFSGMTGYINGSIKEWGRYEKIMDNSGCQRNIEGNPDPLLGDDFKLLSTSPAKNSGVDLSKLSLLEILRDLAGVSRPLGSAWDIGAYECE
jgi:hypothetical protein